MYYFIKSLFTIILIINANSRYLHSSGLSHIYDYGNQDYFRIDSRIYELYYPSLNDNLSIAYNRILEYNNCDSLEFCNPNFVSKIIAMRNIPLDTIFLSAAYFFKDSPDFVLLKYYETNKSFFVGFIRSSQKLYLLCDDNGYSVIGEYNKMVSENKGSITLSNDLIGRLLEKMKYPDKIILYLDSENELFPAYAIFSLISNYNKNLLLLRCRNDLLLDNIADNEILVKLYFTLDIESDSFFRIAQNIRLWRQKHALPIGYESITDAVIKLTCFEPLSNKIQNCRITFFKDHRVKSLEYSKESIILWESN